MHRRRGGRGRPATTRSCQTRSVMNGVSGASSSVTVSSASCRVASAAGSPCQKRRRAAPYVPVGEVVDEGGEQLARLLGVERLQRRVDLRGPACSARRAPSGPGPGGRPGPGPPRRRPGGRTGVQRLEGDGVPVGQQRLADDLLDACCARPGGPTTGEPPAAMNQRTASAPCWSISGIGSRMLPRCLDILRPSSARMWPRQTTFSYDGPVEDQRADRHQRVEPAAGLVDRLGDELRRVAALEQLLVLVRVAELGERHRARVVPGVDHLGHPGRGRAAVRAVEGDLVDERAVRVEARTGRGRSARTARRSEPTQVRWSSSQRQIGSGVPQ